MSQCCYTHYEKNFYDYSVLQIILIAYNKSPLWTTESFRDKHPIIELQIIFHSKAKDWNLLKRNNTITTSHCSSSCSSPLSLDTNREHQGQKSINSTLWLWALPFETMNSTDKSGEFFSCKCHSTPLRWPAAKATQIYQCVKIKTLHYCLSFWLKSIGNVKTYWRTHCILV